MRGDYRFDIQGLRALAILAVLIFHIDPTKLPGGYVGVDLFFVISGFLITQHICRDLDQGIFSFKGFYLKRIRRLYPALIAMIVATSIGVYMIYLPEDARSFGASLMATSVYMSNIFFYTQSDYFDAKIHINPLLHTWSLSVEEQFYIVFPVLLFLIYKTAKARIFLILSVIGALSFILSEIVLRIDASAAFYLSPTRFGQFIAGSLVAIAVPCAFPKKIREAICWTSLGMMGASIVFFSEKTPFPGFYSLIPTVGAAMLIYAGARQDLWATKLMSVPPAQFFGKISYSLYLWHWPIIILYKYYFSSELHGVDKLTAGALCIAAGYASYRFIEQPGLAMDYKKPYFYKMAAIVSLAGIMVGGSFVATDGYASRFTPEQQAISHYLDYEYVNLDEACALSSKSLSADSFDTKKCMATDPQKFNILLMGDSHAAHLYSGLRDEFPEARIAEAVSSGCRPLLGTPAEPRCRIFRDRLFAEYLPAHKYDLIIVSGRWRKEETMAVEKTIAEISKHAGRVVVSGPMIEYSASLPRLIAMSRRSGDGGKSIDASRKYDKIAATDKAMQDAVSKTGAVYFSPLQTLCKTDKTCRIEARENVPMQFDYGHLTHEGSKVIAAEIRQKGLITSAE